MLNKEFLAERMSDGGYRVVQLRPVEVARCRDEYMAHTIAGMLNGHAMADPVDDTIPEDPPQEPEEDPEPGRGKPEPPGSDWSPEELVEAFDALKGGKKLKVVAAGYGKSWTSLRARWAAWRGSKEPAGKLITNTPPQTQLPVPLGQTAYCVTKAAIKELKEQTPCRLCGRYFKETPGRMDVCARCAHA
ncbi:hypothetical protein [Thalassovita sp.]|uniref:hypothetical protein n=1 Tax=Thalassovita sp. TaxID=1979401 RepID=UPI002B269885|nr:hypothetical protein [Thalassovita sp.]